jgi:hypothetical protein
LSTRFPHTLGLPGYLNAGANEINGHPACEESTAGRRPLSHQEGPERIGEPSHTVEGRLTFFAWLHGHSTGHQTLYKALRPDSAPRFDTVSRVCAALGVRLVAQPIHG